MSSKKHLNSILYLFFVILFATIINYISFRHYFCIDMTASGQFTLSEESKGIVSSLSRNYEVIVYFKADHELYEHIRKITSAYSSFSDKLKITFIDPYHDYDKLSLDSEIKKNFRVNSILVKNNKKHKILLIDDLAEYDRSLEQYGIKPELKSIQAESALSSSLLSLENFKNITAAILFDHGEKSPNNDKDDGISKLCRMLKSRDFNLKLLNLKRVEKIAEDIDILISISPRVDFTEEDMEKIADWMNKGKSFLLALDPYISSADSSMLNFNLGPLFKLWGVTLEDTIVVDPVRQVPYSRPDHILVDYYAEHEITRGLKGIPTIFFQARSLKTGESQEISVTRKPLLVSSEHSWGESDYKNPAYSFNDSTDSKGPCILGMAVSDDSSGSKVLIFSDSDLFSNKQFSNPGNNLLAKRSFYWLAENNQALNIKSRKNVKASLRLSKKGQLRIFIWGVLFLPLLVIILALILRYKRSV